MYPLQHNADGHKTSPSPRPVEPVLSTSQSRKPNNGVSALTKQNKNNMFVQNIINELNWIKNNKTIKSDKESQNICK